MLENIEYDIRLEPSTLDHYRLDWTPGADVRLGGMWVPGIVTDDAGQDFLGLRGWSDFIIGMTHTVSPFCGFRALKRSLYADPDHLYQEYATYDWFEPFTYAERNGSLTFKYDSGKLTRDDDGLHWSDAGGRWEMHARTVSDVFILHVPEQPGIEHQVYYRHELLKAHGTVNGAPVEGYLHQDYCYGPPGLTYVHLPIVRQLEGMWVSWIHEYEDGTVGGACFWQGRDDLDFGPGYVLADGVTTAHRDVVATLVLNDDQKVTGMSADAGGRTYEFEFSDQTGPLHYVGRLVADTTGRPIARSWCWVEYANGMLTPEILDMANARYELVWGR
jgi:hypothetical protein